MHTTHVFGERRIVDGRESAKSAALGQLTFLPLRAEFPPGVNHRGGTCCDYQITARNCLGGARLRVAGAHLGEKIEICLDDARPGVGARDE
jgi:hypothetical protein